MSGLKKKGRRIETSGRRSISAFCQENFLIVGRMTISAWLADQLDCAVFLPLMIETVIWFIHSVICSAGLWSSKQLGFGRERD